MIAVFTTPQALSRGQCALPVTQHLRHRILVHVFGVEDERISASSLDFKLHLPVQADGSLVADQKAAGSNPAEGLGTHSQVSDDTEGGFFFVTQSVAAASFSRWEHTSLGPLPASEVLDLRVRRHLLMCFGIGGDVQRLILSNRRQGLESLLGCLI